MKDTTMHLEISCYLSVLFFVELAYFSAVQLLLPLFCSKHEAVNNMQFVQHFIAVSMAALKGKTDYEPLSSSSSLGVNILALNPNGSGKSVMLDPVATALSALDLLSLKLLAMVFTVPEWLTLAWTGMEASSMPSVAEFEGDSVCVGDILL